MKQVLFVCLLVFRVVLSQSQLSNYTFPEGFKFGVATSAYQIEGAWNEGGKSENIWDYALHKNPNWVSDKSNGDITCDSYHKWKEDVQLVKNLGVSFYRFSISWTRIVPSGVAGSKVNQEGIDHYSKLIDALLAEGIVPFVTIFHWDTPQVLEFNGGWLNETIIRDYEYYARILFNAYGDRVKHWITFNEPLQICEFGYSIAQKAPFRKLLGIGGYLCYHHIAIAHGKIYRIYEKEFKETQGGYVGISIDTVYAAPLTDSDLDKQAAEQYMQFYYGWFAHPILLGNYPPVMIQRVDELSKREGFNESRLPKFTNDQIQIINGSFDFLGLNHYTTALCFFNDSGLPEPSLEFDAGVQVTQRKEWKVSAAYWLRSVPWGLRKLLVWIKDNYNNPPVIITENGWATSGKKLQDTDRIDYYQSYLSEILKAIHDHGCNVKGYTAWCLMDNFEWTDGYTLRFGLVYVDFNSPNRTRIPRDSYNVYKRIIQTKRLTNINSSSVRS